MKSLFALALFVMIAGCEHRYRYPCQDPDNWNNKECQEPYCRAYGECTVDLIGNKKAEAEPLEPEERKLEDMKIMVEE